jgi:4-hydroxybenzoyl-CoA thioesterase
MFSHRRNVRIEWSDCDPAGIVFYPRYFSMFDHSTVLLLEAVIGVTKRDLYKAHQFDGYPVIESRAQFLIPTRFCDDVEIETSVTKVGRTSFQLQHRLTKDGALAVEGLVSRVWIVRDATRPGGFRPHPIPQEIVDRLTAATAQP